MIYRKMESFLHIESISEIYLINVFVKRIKSTASLRGSIPNNYSAVYQKELAVLGDALWKKCSKNVTQVHNLLCNFSINLE